MSAARADVSGDTSVAGLNELDGVLAIADVRVEGPRQGRRDEVLERREELDTGSNPLHKVLEEEEVHVAREVAEQTKEICVPGKRGTERAELVRQCRRMHSTVRSNRSAILAFNPRAPLIVGLRSI